MTRLSCPWWCVALAALLAWTTACAAPDQPLPFVQANGLVGGEVRYADVVQALGEPPERRITPSSGYGWRAGGEDFLLAYPQQGLSFVIDREDRPKGDPPVESMWVAAPAQAQTPQGLHVGMPTDQALQLLQAHYREESRHHFGGHPTPSNVVVSDRHGQGRRQLSVSFDNGAVSSLVFDLRDRPWLTRSERRGLGQLAVLAVLLAGLVGWVKLRARLGFKPTAYEPKPDHGGPRPGLLVTALVVFVGAAVAAAVGLPIARGGGYEAYFGLAMLATGGGLVLVGGVLLTRSGYRAATWLGALIVGGWLLAAVLPKLVG